MGAEGADVAVPITGPCEAPKEGAGPRKGALIAGTCANTHLGAIPVAEAPSLVGRLTRQAQER